jgi:hypothetical protein
VDDRVRRALRHGHTIDITTTGRRTGLARRIEIVFHNFGGRLYITHLKRPVPADLPATARIITDEGERRAVFTEVVKVWTGQDVETMTRHSPLIEVFVDDAG